MILPHIDWVSAGEVAIFGFAGLGIIKKSLLDMLSAQNKTLETTNKNLLVQLATTQRTHASTLRKVGNEMTVIQRKLMLLEFENESKVKILENRDHEIRILESGLELAIQLMIKLNIPEADAITTKLVDLSEFRVKSRIDFEAWETAHKAAVEKLASSLTYAAIDDANADDAEDVFSRYLKTELNDKKH